MWGIRERESIDLCVPRTFGLRSCSGCTVLYNTVKSDVARLFGTVIAPRNKQASKQESQKNVCRKGF